MTYHVVTNAAEFDTSKDIILNRDNPELTYGIDYVFMLEGIALLQYARGDRLSTPIDSSIGTVNASHVIGNIVGNKISYKGESARDHVGHITSYIHNKLAENERILDEPITNNTTISLGKNISSAVYSDHVYNVGEVPTWREFLGSQEMPQWYGGTDEPIKSVASMRALEKSLASFCTTIVYDNLLLKNDGQYSKEILDVATGETRKERSDITSGEIPPYYKYDYSRVVSDNDDVTGTESRFVAIPKYNDLGKTDGLYVSVQSHLTYPKPILDSAKANTTHDLIVIWSVYYRKIRYVDNGATEAEREEKNVYFYTVYENQLESPEVGISYEWATTIWDVVKKVNIPNWSASRQWVRAATKGESRYATCTIKPACAFRVTTINDFKTALQEES